MRYRLMLSILKRNQAKGKSINDLFMNLNTQAVIDRLKDLEANYKYRSESNSKDMQRNNSVVPEEYEPFLYPPNYDLARLHKAASMPGSAISPQRLCPCCKKAQKRPFESWLDRSIDKDFKSFGGSVVTYFWLLKLYLFVVALILVVYSGYLTYCIQEYCSDSEPECKNLLGIWIVSNESLYSILKRREGEGNGIIVRLLTMRGVVFVILMLANALSLVLVKKFKQIYPTKVGVADYSLLFKNARMSVQELTLQIKQKIEDVEIKQVLKINSLEPFYTLYQEKINTYYALQNEEKPKKRRKLLSQLIAFEKSVNQAEPKFNTQGERLLVIFNCLDERDAVLQFYKAGPRQKLNNYLDVQAKQGSIYCQQAPQPSQIIWQNIGSGDEYKLKYKIISVVYFLLLLVASYVILFFCMELVYKKWFDEPWNFIMVNVILIFVVYIALTFRALMNRLSELSHPSTYTARTMFIVATTVSFHFIYYVIIPTVYFSLADDEKRNQVLKMVTNQVLNFVLFQFIIVGVDLMHCCWNKNLKKVENEEKPYGCQKILHANMQYPRFPIEFKLIIMFKLWSFTIFFAFQSPLVLFSIFICLIFLLFKDKHSVYYHYRMEIINNKVQFNFLRIYSTFFSVYMFAIFVLTQHLWIEFWTSLGFTVFMVVVQLAVLGRNFDRDRQIHKNQQIAGSAILESETYEELEIKESYKQLYNDFVNGIKSDALDIEIRNYLHEAGIKSIRTDTGTQPLLDQ